MKKFDDLTRVSLEKHGGNPYALKEIKSIESMARAARERGENPPITLAHKVDELKQKIHLGNMQMAKEYERLVDESRIEYERQRDKKPEAELARMRRAEMFVDSMSPEEQAEAAHKYATDQVDLNMEEANILASRVNTIDSYQALKMAMKAKRVNQPWLQDPEVSYMADEAKRYGALEYGHLVVQTADGKVAANVETLIDFENELGREA